MQSALNYFYHLDVLPSTTDSLLQPKAEPGEPPFPLLSWLGLLSAKVRLGDIKPQFQIPTSIGHESYR
jgi:hypothetical protein